MKIRCPRCGGDCSYFKEINGKFVRATCDECRGEGEIEIGIKDDEDTNKR